MLSQTVSAQVHLPKFEVPSLYGPCTSAGPPPHPVVSHHITSVSPAAQDVVQPGRPGHHLAEVHEEGPPPTPVVTSRPTGQARAPPCRNARRDAQLWSTGDPRQLRWPRRPTPVGIGQVRAEKRTGFAQLMSDSILATAQPSGPQPTCVLAPETTDVMILRSGVTGQF